MSPVYYHFHVSRRYCFRCPGRFPPWNQMCAGALLATLPGIILVFVAQKYLIQGLTTGALKS